MTTTPGETPTAGAVGEVARGFLMKRWEVTVRWAHGGCTVGPVVAPTRGKALANTWRSDAFNAVSFGQFLRFTSCRRDPYRPARWGDPITIEGKPAFFLDNNRQYVQFVYPGGDHVLNAHPYDVLPEEYRPDTYRAHLSTAAHGREGEGR